LTAETMEEAEKQEAQDEASETDVEDEIARTVQARGPQKNLSYFAFTATPKHKTLELFGQDGPDGRPEPFHVYSMRQAIEEGFILDVLKNYVTYKTYYRLAKAIEDDPEFDRAKASQAVARFVSLHPHNVAQKTEVIVEHFRNVTRHKIGGKAKAMVVARSRLHAVRYFHAFRAYLKEKSYADIGVLVAFSGTVKDGGLDYTEPGMNGFGDKELPAKYDSDKYHLLLVAEKYQTGFDQPLLHTMYVDKKLGGVNAVQTLSRLNRTLTPEKKGTTVLDFANEGDVIKTAFEPYYEATLLSEATDPNLLYEIQTRLGAFPVYTEADVDGFANIYFDPKATQDRLYAMLAPVVERFRALSDEEQHDFRVQITDYVRLYAFLAQVLTFADADLEKLYVFARPLRRLLPGDRAELPREVQQNIDMESYTSRRPAAARSLSSASPACSTRRAPRAAMGRRPRSWRRSPASSPS
jgi:type I restriction enzyme R subunit